MTGALLPEDHEVEDFIRLILFADGRVGVTEDPGVGVMSEERQHALLPPAALGNIVLLQQRVVAVMGNGVEIEIEGGAPCQTGLTEGIEPVTHQSGKADGVDAATVICQEGTLGNDIEAGKQSQTFIQYVAHDVAGAGVAKEFQRQQGADRMGSRDHLGTRQADAADETIKRDGREEREEEEQAAELGMDGPWLEIELFDIGNVGRGRS